MKPLLWLVKINIGALKSSLFRARNLLLQILDKTSILSCEYLYTLIAQEAPICLKHSDKMKSKTKHKFTQQYTFSINCLTEWIDNYVMNVLFYMLYVNNKLFSVKMKSMISWKQIKINFLHTSKSLWSKHQNPWKSLTRTGWSPKAAANLSATLMNNTLSTKTNNNNNTNNIAYDKTVFEKNMCARLVECSFIAKEI